MNINKLNYYLIVIIILPSLTILFGSVAYDFMVWNINCGASQCVTKIYTFGSEAIILTIGFITTELGLLFGKGVIFGKEKEFIH